MMSRQIDGLCKNTLLKQHRKYNRGPLFINYAARQNLIVLVEESSTSTIDLQDQYQEFIISRLQ